MCFKLKEDTIVGSVNMSVSIFGLFWIIDPLELDADTMHKF